MRNQSTNTTVDPMSESRPAPACTSDQLFDAAFREHHATLVHFLRRRVRSDDEARDIAQEAYLRLLHYRENQDLGSLKALVFRIAANVLGMRARTARARHQASHQSLDDHLDIAINDIPVEQRLIGEQQLDRLMNVIGRLPMKCQQVFVLSRFHDMGYSQIAARCGISIKMVEKHISRALQICRTEVGYGKP
jgi:RNA polymerase sigma factor (sigma-70 family)